MVRPRPATAPLFSYTTLFRSSNLPGIPKGDMFVAVASKSAWHAVGEQIGSLLTFINKTYSETGQVKLASRDWRRGELEDRKSTRLNSSHITSSYAVFCLKKKN